MRFHPTGRGHEDDEDGQEGCSTTANASLIGQTGDWLALQDLIMMLPSRLGCPLSLKTPNMGNTGYFTRHLLGSWCNCRRHVPLLLRKAIDGKP